jgi:hypothetical protein
MARKKFNSFDYFVSGVEPNTIFIHQVRELKELVNASKDFVYSAHNYGNTTAEVCLIGLSAQFESYCKIQFASLINIYPPLLEKFCNIRDNVSLPIIDVYKLSAKIKYNFGSLLSEIFDFGTAKSINSLYKDLLSVSLFSKAESKKYAEFLNKRNILVHHGGILTYKYVRQNYQSHSLEEAHCVLFIDKNTFLQWNKFLTNMVLKINRVCYKRLNEIIREDNYKLNINQKEAIEQYMYGSKGIVAT